MRPDSILTSITPAQCRAARALLQWTQGELAERARLARKTVADFENGHREVHIRTRHDLQETFERAGIVFLPDGCRMPKAA